MALTDCAYLLEIVEWPGGKPVVSLALPFVQSLRVTEPSAVGLTYTLGTQPIREPAGGVRERQIAITGHSGVGLRLGATALGRELFDDGPTLYAELRAFINNYLAITREKFPSRRMVFRALAEEDEWYVEPIAPVSERNVQTSRFSWLYTLTFRAYQKADAQVLSPPASWFAELKRAAKAATKAVNSVTLYVAKANQTIKDTRAAFAAFLGPIQAVGRMMDEVQDLAKSAQELERLPADFVRAATDVMDRGIQAFAEILLTLPYVERGEIQETFAEVLGKLGDSRRAMLEVVGLRLPSRPWSAPVSAGTETPLGAPATGVTSSALAVPYVVRAGETLASIAAAAGSTPTEIATLNGMTDFQTLPNGAPLGPGVTLLVPAFSGLPVPTAGGSADTQSWQSAEVFGVGLQLSADGDLILLGNDFARVQGSELYRQALKMRCTTELGESGVFPGYGIIPVVGEGAVATTLGRLASSVREQLLRDSRTASVRNVKVETLAAGGYAVRADVTPRAGPTIPLAVPVGA